MSIGTFNTGSDTHLLDHIAPLASILEAPLIVTEEENRILAQRYYPEVQTELWPDIEFRLKEIGERFDLIIESKYWAPQLKQLIQTLYGKTVRLVFCPHGQSDKGYQTPLLAPYALQDAVLIYGDLLKQMLTELNIWPHIKDFALIGNHRLSYYLKNRTRLDATVEKEIFSQLKQKNKTLFYAPTWRDADGATTFFSDIQLLYNQLPDDWNVIVKPHPLLEQRDLSHYERLHRIREQKNNWLVLERFPLIYPILDRIDAYLGDYSSVGYDALAMQKPLYFLSHHHIPNPRLHLCGKILDRSKNLFDQIQKNEQNYSKQQRALSTLAFTPGIDVKGQITQLLAGEGRKQQLNRKCFLQ